MDDQTQERVRNWLKRARENLRAAEYEFGGEFYARAISTAYYAMFYAATAALASIGIARAKHSGVASAFGENLIRTGELDRRLARMFSHTMEEREGSDYSEIPEITGELALQSITDAREFVEAIAIYLSGKGIAE